MLSNNKKLLSEELINKVINLLIDKYDISSSNEQKLFHIIYKAIMEINDKCHHDDINEFNIYDYYEIIYERFNQIDKPINKDYIEIFPFEY